VAGCCELDDEPSGSGTTDLEAERDLLRPKHDADDGNSLRGATYFLRR
jgi:hypothetical protein